MKIHLNRQQEEEEKQACLRNVNDGFCDDASHHGVTARTRKSREMKQRKVQKQTQKPSKHRQPQPKDIRDQEMDMKMLNETTAHVMKIKPIEMMMIWRQRDQSLFAGDVQRQIQTRAESTRKRCDHGPSDGETVQNMKFEEKISMSHKEFLKTNRSSKICKPT